MLAQMMEDKQERLSKIDWQPALMSDSAPEYQKTPLKGSLAYLSSVMNGYAPNSANPWDAPGTQERKDAEFAQQHGDTLPAMLNKDVEDLYAINYKAKKPKPVNTDAITWEGGTDVSGRRR